MAADVDALVGLRAQMFAAMGISEDDSSWRENAGQWFHERVDDPAYGIYVIEVGDGVVACAVGAIRDAAPSPTAPLGGDVLISNVCTDSEHRGRGHGRAVFEAVMRWARQTGTSRAELMATSGGQAIYEDAGFSATQSLAMRLALT